MGKKIKLSLLALLVGGFLGSQVSAAEITYQPVNPNFGGNPFNAAPLLANAGAQNGFTAPQRSSRDSARDFAERLDRSILSRLSRALTNDIIDSEGNFVTGTFQTGINTIVVQEAGGSTFVTITNTETGEVSVIEIPNS